MNTFFSLLLDFLLVGLISFSNLRPFSFCPVFLSIFFFGKQINFVWGACNHSCFPFFFVFLLWFIMVCFDKRIISLGLTAKALWTEPLGPGESALLESSAPSFQPHFHRWFLARHLLLVHLHFFPLDIFSGLVPFSTPLGPSSLLLMGMSCTSRSKIICIAKDIGIENRDILPFDKMSRFVDVCFDLNKHINWNKK